MELDYRQLDFIDSKLKVILSYLEKETGLKFRVTSLYRPGDAGVHGTLPLRGIDLGCRNLEVGEVLAKLVNEKFVYDPSRPGKTCAMVHDAGSGLHLHLQVHPSTVEKD